MYSAFDKSTIQKAEIFCHIAQDLWEKDKYCDSYLTIAGAVLLSLSLIGHGKDHAVHSYAHEALNMGRRLSLFEDENARNKILYENFSREEMTMRCHAAWGVFNWNV